MPKVPEEKIEFPIKVFVYGTLKRSYGNHHFLEKAQFLKNAATFGILLHLGGFPGFLPASTGMRVEGEVYEVKDQETLNGLDRLEGHPNHYIRQKISLAGGETVWTYVYNRYTQTNSGSLNVKWNMVKSGNWDGQRAYCTTFMGFFEGTWPPKTGMPAVAHVKIPGEFSGLIDCLTGLILRDNWKAEGKPHLIYDLQSKLWVPASANKGRTIDQPAQVAKHDGWVPYIDACDPGEIDGPARPLEKVA